MSHPPNQLKGSDIHFVLNNKQLADTSKLKQGPNDISPGEVSIKLGTNPTTGKVDRSATTVNINLDLSFGVTEKDTRHETQHAVQADNDPEAFKKALDAGPGTPGYEARQKDAEAFANKPEKPDDKPSMTQDEAEKAVKDALQEDPHKKHQELCAALPAGCPGANTIDHPAQPK